MPGPTPTAVLFDLYGTLAPGGDATLRDSVSRRCAELLGVEAEAFSALVRETFPQRTTGRLGDVADTMHALAKQLGGDPSPEVVDEVVAIRVEMTASLIGRSTAAPVLAALRESGLRVAVVTDCSGETPDAWPDGPLAGVVDAIAFSSVVGVCKPDARMYLTVTDELGVDPAECVYVGDGGSNELPGAQELGMHAVWLTDPSVGSQTIAGGFHWDGPKLDLLTDLTPERARAFRHS